MSKIAIYTCLVGNYDTLKQPVAVDEDVDFICFSNEFSQSKIGLWQIRRIPYECEDKTRQSRYVKINPHIALPEYEYSVWIDANIQIIKNNFYVIIKDLIRQNEILAQVPHIERDCVYKEIIECIRRGKVKGRQATKQFLFLQNRHYPRHYGLYENNIIFRKHNTDKIIAISKDWWQLYLKYTKRDQFSLCYIYWEKNISPAYLFGKNKNSRNVEFLKMTPFHNRSKRSVLSEISHLYNKYIVNRFYILFLEVLYLKG